MVKELPRIVVKGKCWYIDTRLKEVRQVRCPHHRMSIREFDEKFELGLGRLVY